MATIWTGVTVNLWFREWSAFAAIVFGDTSPWITPSTIFPIDFVN